MHPAPQAAVSDGPVRVIRPPAPNLFDLGLRELWSYRELLAFLTWRNILVRYKQTLLGVSWAIIQPLFLMVVFSIFFGRVAKIGSEGFPYPIFAYAGLLPWTLFATSVGLASNSLVGNSNLIGKVYFPRLALPISSTLSSVVDFFLALLVLFGLMGYYDIAPRWQAVFVLPTLLLLTVAIAIGVGIWFSGLNVSYRDVQYAVPFLLQLLFFSTPILYSVQSVGQPWQTLYGLNPMATVVAGFRYALLGAPAPAAGMLALSVAVTAVVLAIAVSHFRRMEHYFADVI